MAEYNAPQNMQDDELSVDELDEVAGGVGDTVIINSVPGCGGDYNGNCPKSGTGTIGAAPADA
jgi:hypothetical protein